MKLNKQIIYGLFLFSALAFINVAESQEPPQTGEPDTLTETATPAPEPPVSTTEDISEEDKQKMTDLIQHVLLKLQSDNFTGLSSLFSKEVLFISKYMIIEVITDDEDDRSKPFLAELSQKEMEKMPYDRFCEWALQTLYNQSKGTAPEQPSAEVTIKDVKLEKKEFAKVEYFTHDADQDSQPKTIELVKLSGQWKVTGGLLGEHFYERFVTDPAVDIHGEL